MTSPMHSNDKRMRGSRAAKTPHQHQQQQQQQRKAFLLHRGDHTKPLAVHSARFAPHNNDDNDDDNDNDNTNAYHDSAAHLASDVDTDAFKQAMWAGQASILVTVRLRPRLEPQQQQQQPLANSDLNNRVLADDDVVKVLDHKLVVVLDTAAAAADTSSSSTAVHLSPVRRSQTSHPSRTLRPSPSTATAASPANPATRQQQQQQHQRRHHHGRSREKRFAFDYVFTPDDSQQTVYCHTTKFLIHGVLQGFNATVFAYGCTGAGKTYTMLGTPDEPGIMGRTLTDLFATIERTHADPLATVSYKVSVSFLEVYNETIRDLLVSSTPAGLSVAAQETLDVREDPVKGAVVAGLLEIEACNAQDVMKLLRRGNRHRSQEATAANAVSSRSHAVLQVLVEQRDRPSGEGDPDSVDADSNAVATVVKFGKLSLVDLAGSERAAVTQNRGQRLLEGANINRSLLALGNCINALGARGKDTTSSSNSRTNGKPTAAAAAATPTYIGYRDSKLTRLLKDSLGGNCRTVMIANVSPAAASVEETLNTLKYANRAKNIQTTAVRNVLRVDHHVTEYVHVIVTLRDEVASLKHELARQQQSMQQMHVLPPVAPLPTTNGLWQKQVLAARPQRNCNNNNNIDNNNNFDTIDNLDNINSNNRLLHAAIDGAINAQLEDVRCHIAQYFAERVRLREAQLRSEHELHVLEASSMPSTTSSNLLVATAVVSRSSPEVRTRESDKVDATSAAAAVATSLSSLSLSLPEEEEACDVTLTLPSTGADSTFTTASATVSQAPGGNDSSHTNNNANEQQLLQHCAVLAQELAQLETHMLNFHAAIVASAFVRDHALVRDVLAMEYRVGQLQVDNMELRVVNELRGQTDAAVSVNSGKLPNERATQFALPLLSLASPSKAVAAAAAPRASPASSRVALTTTATSTASERSPRSTNGFISDLCDRFQLRKGATATTTQSLQSLSLSQPLPLRPGEPTTASARRQQWGLRLPSAALPYIRLKPKPTLKPATTSSIDGRSNRERDQQTLELPQLAPSSQSSSTSIIAAPTSASASGPYLRVLKHRRKSQQRQQHQHNNNNKPKALASVH